MEILLAAILIILALAALLFYLLRKSSGALYDKNFLWTFTESFFRQSPEQSASFVDSYLESKNRTQKTRIEDVKALIMPLFTAATEDDVFSRSKEESLMSFLNVYGIKLQDLNLATSVAIIQTCLIRDLREGVVMPRIAVPDLPQLSLAKDEHPIWADMALVAEVLESQHNVVINSQKNKKPKLKELDDTTLLLTSENLYIFPKFDEPFTISLKDIHTVTKISDHGITIQISGGKNSTYMLEYFDVDFWLSILENAKNWSAKK